MIFQPKTRLGLIGKNGSGKTSFIRAILDQIPIQTGRISIGFNTEFNYQDQEKKLLNETKTAFDEIGDGDERTQFGETTIGVRSYLKRFLFDNNQINSQIKNFSGGEKARLLLAKLFKAGGNCLVLDEPTNDLDLETIRLLEESLNNFEGISIVISHDRYFLNRVCNTILELKGEGKFVLSDGNYDDYLAKNRPFEFGEVEVKIKDPEKISKKEQRILQKQIRDVEKEIESLEIKIKDLEIEFAASDFYTKTPKEITKKIIQLDDLKILLAKAMGRWEELNQ
jgi:ATP-binding cassette subfamily F protein uup